MSALKVLQVMKAKSATLAELADCMSEYPAQLVNLKVKEKPPIESIPALVEAIGAAEAAFGDEGRTLVRYSGTEKKIRILVEAKDAVLAGEQSAKLVAAVQSTIGV